MKFAAFETATEWCSVALWLDGEIRALERRAPNAHAEFALPMLERLLREAKVAVRELQAVAFGAGPGAFTGLRIACGIAQGLALARGIPVLGVSTLEAIAEACGAPRVVACLDARMNEVYCAAFERSGERWIERLAARCAPPDALALPQGADWVGAGGGFAVHGAMGLARVFPEIHPSAAAVARLAAPRLAAGEGVDPAQAQPDYVRDKVARTRAERLAR